MCIRDSNFPVAGAHSHGPVAEVPHDHHDHHGGGHEHHAQHIDPFDPRIQNLGANDFLNNFHDGHHHQSINFDQFGHGHHEDHEDDEHKDHR